MNPEPPPLLAGTQDDDGRPYTVPGDPVAPPVETKPEPPRPALAKSWDMHWSLAGRIKVFRVLLIINTIVAVPFGWLFFQSVTVVVTTFVFASLMQAYLLGTFDRITLTRSAKGKVKLTRTWRIAFFPLKPRSLRWGDFESLSLGQSCETHLEDWAGAIMLLPFGIIPAVLWWWYVVRPDQFDVALCKDHGFRDTILYRGADRAQAEEVAQTIADATGLPLT